MRLRGKSSYDITPSPVLMTNSQIFLPPTGGEEDTPSLYNPASQPLPSSANRKAYGIFKSGTANQTAVNITFTLAGCRGHRRITFQEDEIIITDQVDTDAPSDIYLFRLLVPAGLAFEEPDETQIDFPELNLHLIADRPIQIADEGLFAVTGPVRTIFVPNQSTATLRIAWSPS